VRGRALNKKVLALSPPSGVELPEGYSRFTCDVCVCGRCLRCFHGLNACAFELEGICYVNGPVPAYQLLTP
jgi:hypothetical protein